jgi:hypothetical protein
MNFAREIPLYVLHYYTFLCPPLLIGWRLRLLCLFLTQGPFHKGFLTQCFVQLYVRNLICKYFQTHMTNPTARRLKSQRLVWPNIGGRHWVVCDALRPS